MNANISPMCARIRIDEMVVKPCERLPVWRAPGRLAHLVWAGFARLDSLGWWEEHGGVLIDVPAHEFAERSRQTGNLIWAGVPAGHVIRGVLDSREGAPILKVVMRPPTDEELARFDHPRMPVLAPPLFSAEAIAVLPSPQREFL